MRGDLYKVYNLSARPSRHGGKESVKFQERKQYGKNGPKTRSVFSIFDQLRDKISSP